MNFFHPQISINPRIQHILKSGFDKCLKGFKLMWDKIALAVLIVGGLNWGLVGIFQFDIIAWLFGGTAAVMSRVLYIIVALAAVWCISLLFRDERAAQRQT